MKGTFALSLTAFAIVATSASAQLITLEATTKMAGSYKITGSYDATLNGKRCNEIPYVLMDVAGHWCVTAPNKYVRREDGVDCPPGGDLDFPKEHDWWTYFVGEQKCNIVSVASSQTYAIEARYRCTKLRTPGRWTENVTMSFEGGELIFKRERVR